MSPDASSTARVSVVVPAYRERARIGGTVTRLRAELEPAVGPVEIVVADDGSDDGTADAARAAGADVVLALHPNRGKGAAVRAGMLEASAPTVLFVDADLAYPPSQIPVLVERVEAGDPVVVGSRHHVDTTTLVKARRLREVTGRLFNLLTAVVLATKVRDTQCGLKAFDAEAARSIFARTRIDGFAFDVEVLHLAGRLGFPVVEVPVELANSEISTVNVARDALRMLRDLVRVRWWDVTGGYGRGRAV